MLPDFPKDLGIACIVFEMGCMALDTKPGAFYRVGNDLPKVPVREEGELMQRIRMPELPSVLLQ